MRFLPRISNARTSRFSKKLEQQVVRKQRNKKRKKETKTDVPELDFISKVCTGGGGQGE